MSLSDLASLGSFVSGLAVLVSLVFLYFQLGAVRYQIEQAERNQQAAIRQARSTRSADGSLRLAMEPSAIDAMILASEGREDISEQALMQYHFFLRAQFYGWEDAFYQHRDGLFSDSALEAYAVTIRRLLQAPGARAQWRLQRGFFAPDFVAWVDELVSQAPAIDVGGRLERWKKALAAERANEPY